MKESIKYVDKNYRLNQFFSFLIVYYWALIYIKPAPYILQTLPIGLFIGYATLIYIKNFSSFNKISSLLIFIFIAVYLSLIRSDYTSLIAVTLFGLTIFFIEYFKLRVTLKLINTLFFISIVLSVPLYYSGYNYFGFMPGQGGFSNTDILSGRVSMFPSVTVSIYFSFIIFFINYFFNKDSYQKIFILIFSLYFIYFGVSRTVMLVLLFILFFSLLFKFYPLKKNWFYQIFLPVILILMPILLVSFIEDIVSFFLSLNSEFISKYFFRGYTSVEKILDDIARTNIWSEHISLFKEYPWGLSVDELLKYSDRSLMLNSEGSESFLTRILVRFGFSAFFFYLFIISLLQRAVNTKNHYMYIFFYIFIFIGVTYGSFFAAYNFLFLIFISSLNYHKEE